MRSSADGGAGNEGSEMEIPNRLDVVRRICESSPVTFETGLSDAEHDARRLALLPTIIRALNQVDPGMWGLLRKDDQGGKIPCDIAAWRDPLTTVDVMTSSGASWQVHPGGVQNPHWRFLPVASLPVDPPVDPPTGPPTPDPTLDRRLEGIERRIDELQSYTLSLQRVSDADRARIVALEEQVKAIPTKGTARIFGIAVPVVLSR